MNSSYLVIISHKYSSLSYLYFVPAESNVKAMHDAWESFQEQEAVEEEEWLLSSAEISLDEKGPQQLARLNRA
jgi:hypothetical protein